MSDKDCLPHVPTDDDRVPMSGEEKVAWVYGVMVIITSGTYFTWLTIQLANKPVDEIAWEVPMIVAIAASIVGVIIGVILSAIAGAVWQSARGRYEEPDFTKDERDRAIEQLGNRRTFTVMSIGSGAALVLAMLDADTFWIGNALFLAGTVGAILEVTTKIRAYHRGM
jgi:uncharacterized membrane protein